MTPEEAKAKDKLLDEERHRRRRDEIEAEEKFLAKKIEKVKREVEANYRHQRKSTVEITNEAEFYGALLQDKPEPELINEHPPSQLLRTSPPPTRQSTPEFESTASEDEREAARSPNKNLKQPNISGHMRRHHKQYTYKQSLQTLIRTGRRVHTIKKKVPQHQLPSRGQPPNQWWLSNESQ